MNCFDGPTCIKRTSSRSDSERKCSSTGTRRHRRSSRIPDGERDHGDRVARRSTAPSRSLPDSPTWGSGANTSATHLWKPASSQSAGSRSISSFTVRLRTALKFSESFMAQGTFTLCSGMMLSLSTPPNMRWRTTSLGCFAKARTGRRPAPRRRNASRPAHQPVPYSWTFRGCGGRPWVQPKGAALGSAPPLARDCKYSVLSEKSESEGGRSILPLLCRTLFARGRTWSPVACGYEAPRPYA